MPQKPGPSSSSANFTEADFSSALTSFGSTKSKLLIDDPKMFKATFDLLKAVASSDPIAGASAIASGASTSGKFFAPTSSVTTGLRMSSFAASTFKASMDLTKVARLSSPGAVLAFVGATTVQKTGLAVSIAGGDSERAKCIGALMELAGSATVTAITAPTGVLALLSAASLTASTYNAYYSCLPLAAPLTQ